MKNLLTQESLKNILDYSELTGVFTWKITSSKAKKGNQAGGLTGDGYIRIRIKGAPYLAHRLAFLYVFGRLPLNIIDHINHTKTDNRITNLREVNYSVNMQNQSRATSRSVSGLLGASPCRDKFQSQIKLHGKTTYLGLFDTAQEAHKNYILAKRRLHEGCSI